MHAETRLQLQFLKWWGYACAAEKLDPRLLSHCPNGGKRRLTEAQILNGMGVRAGHEDLFLVVPRHGAHGLYLELKSEDGRVDPPQREMMKIHENQGYAVCVCWSFDEAVSAIGCYLKTGNPLLKSAPAAR